jgi:hypothetical protein
MCTFKVPCALLMKWVFQGLDLRILRLSFA